MKKKILIGIVVLVLAAGIYYLFSSDSGTFKGSIAGIGVQRSPMSVGNISVVPQNVAITIQAPSQSREQIQTQAQEKAYAVTTDWNYSEYFFHTIPVYRQNTGLFLACSRGASYKAEFEADLSNIENEMESFRSFFYVPNDQLNETSAQRKYRVWASMIYNRPRILQLTNSMEINFEFMVGILGTLKNSNCLSEDAISRAFTGMVSGHTIQYPANYTRWKNDLNAFYAMPENR